jgi:hypothetical protein
MTSTTPERRAAAARGPCEALALQMVLAEQDGAPVPFAQVKRTSTDGQPAGEDQGLATRVRGSHAELELCPAAQPAALGLRNPETNAAPAGCPPQAPIRKDEIAGAGDPGAAQASAQLNQD